MNDVAPEAGGSTRFYDINNTSQRVDFECAPRAGEALIFRQPPAAQYYHDGEELRSGVKYLFRTDVMYRVIPREKKKPRQSKSGTCMNTNTAIKGDTTALLLSLKQKIIIHGEGSIGTDDAHRIGGWLLAETDTEAEVLGMIDDPNILSAALCRVLGKEAAERREKECGEGAGSSGV